MFTYLVRFREHAASAAAPGFTQARQDLQAILARMDEGVKRQVSLDRPLDQVRYPLVALADEVLTTSGWTHGQSWARAPLEKDVFDTSNAGMRFFELAAELDSAPRDVVAIYYLCLALGFCGRYDPDDPRLEAIKQRLMARLPMAPELGSPRDRQAVATATPKPVPKPAPKKAPKTVHLPKSSDHGGKGPWLGVAVALVVVVGGVWLWMSPSLEFMRPAQTPGHTVQTPPAAQPQPAKPATKTLAPAPAPAPAPAKKAAALGQPASMAAKAPTPQAKEDPPAPSTKPAPSAPDPESPAPPKPPAAEPLVAKLPSPLKSAPATQPEPASKAAVVKPAPTKPQPAKPRPSPAQPRPKEQPPGRTYRVQAGVFVGPVQSSELVDKLLRADLPARVVRMGREGLEGTEPWYVVVVQPIKGLDSAQQVQGILREKFGIAGIVRKLK